MKNTKREVIERLVSLNHGEIDFLQRLCNAAETELSHSGTSVSRATMALVERVGAKLSRAQRARYAR